MSRWLIALVAVALLAAACAEEQPAGSSGPELVSTTVDVPTTTAGPIESTSAAPTVPATSTSSTTTTTSTTTTRPLSDLELQLVEVARGFEQPVLALSPPGDDRLFVVDQPGRIWLLTGDRPEVFLDIRDEVVFGGERGLLGLAFDPGFAADGRFFVDYTGDLGRTVVAEFRAEGDSVDPATQQILLEIDQPARNHNGGMIAFGPDGYLWVATGDGGGANDQYGNGQRPDTLLGALLRLDTSAAGEYSIPDDNPFADGTGAPEVWAYGLRNPWRFSFDGDVLYVADVGQNDWEEVDVLPVADSRGANFGWSVFEGESCFRGPCDTTGTVAPTLVYGHDEGCSITGGFVYRGTALPELAGHYFFADYCGGWVRSISQEGDVTEWFAPSSGRAVTSFGRDAAGELYVVTRGGSVYRIERA